MRRKSAPARRSGESPDECSTATTAGISPVNVVKATKAPRPTKSPTTAIDVTSPGPSETDQRAAANPAANPAANRSTALTAATESRAVSVQTIIDGAEPRTTL